MSDSRRRNSQVWKEIKPFAVRDLMKETNKTSGGGDDEYAILLYKVATRKLKKYSVSETGLQAALAGASSGDAVYLPAGTFSGNHTVPAGVALVGVSKGKSILTGQITLSGSHLENVTVDRDEDSAGAIYGVIDAGAGTSYIKNCTIDVANSTGAAYAVYLANGGTFYVYDSNLLALTGSDGYAAYVSDGSLYQIGGRAKGTETLMPYNY